MLQSTDDARVGVHGTLGMLGILIKGGLPARRPRPQHVQAHPRDDGRQPGSQVLDRADIGAAESNPAFLDGILGFAR